MSIQALKYNKLTGILVLVMPFLILAGMAGNASLQQNIGDHVWQIKIRGYDPRDLLYGHYLTFRYDWNIDRTTASQTPAYDDTCLCLNAAGQGNKDPQARVTSCAMTVKNHCESLVRVYGYNENYVLNNNGASERYLIPEENAKMVEDLLRTGQQTLRVEMMTRKNGSATVRGLYVGDILLEDYLRHIGN